MDGFVRAASVRDIPPGSKKTISISGRSIAIANVDGEIFAIDDTCSHEHCSLGTEGFLDGSVIICGCHGAQFDVTNGKVLSLPAVVDIRSYDVAIHNGEIMVKI